MIDPDREAYFRDGTHVSYAGGFVGMMMALMEVTQGLATIEPIEIDGNMTPFSRVTEPAAVGGRTYIIQVVPQDELVENDPRVPVYQFSPNWRDEL